MGSIRVYLAVLAMMSINICVMDATKCLNAITTSSIICILWHCPCLVSQCVKCLGDSLNLFNNLYVLHTCCPCWLGNCWMWQYVCGACGFFKLIAPTLLKISDLWPYELYQYNVHHPLMWCTIYLVWLLAPSQASIENLFKLFESHGVWIPFLW